MMGHYGYSREHAVGQRMLDVLGYQIGDGTVEAQNLILVREILGKEFLPYR
jgi:cyclohexanecarboxyl-CoA dehydrogenase